MNTDLARTDDGMDIIPPERAAKAEEIAAWVEEWKKETERKVLTFWHGVGKHLSHELQVEWRDGRCRVGGYGEYVIRTVAERADVDVSMIYLAMKLAHRYPDVQLLTAGQKSLTWREARLVLPLSEGDARHVVAWYQRPWEAGEYVWPGTDDTPPEILAEGDERIGRAKVYADLATYVRGLRIRQGALRKRERHAAWHDAVRQLRGVAKTAPSQIVRAQREIIAAVSPQRIDPDERQRLATALDDLDEEVNRVRSSLALSNEGGE